uniref:Uncharacterized protein n=1 Tax=Knipowitschia caucasica TaxID=637954 RepID=A0AAV2KFE2_KNICA
MARLQISALHYNENATRTHARTAAGELRYSIVYPKYKHGDYTVRALKTKFTTFYIDKLMSLLFEANKKADMSQPGHISNYEPEVWEDRMDLTLRTLHRGTSHQSIHQ